MNVIAIIQARIGSSRLPGKVLLDLEGKTVLERVVERVQRISGISGIVIATTTKPTDDPIVETAEKCGVGWSRGSENDVLSRYYDAARKAEADVVIRITSDCPVIDPEVSSKVVCKFLDDGNLDYLSNTIERSYPRGLDTEVFTFSALEKANQNARLTYEREHVTPYIYQHPEMFLMAQVVNPVDLNELRWTLDTEEDYTLIREIYQELYSANPSFLMEDILQLIQRRPELAEINAHIEQKKLGE